MALIFRCLKLLSSFLRKKKIFYKKKVVKIFNLQSIRLTARRLTYTDRSCILNNSSFCRPVHCAYVGVRYDSGYRCSLHDCTTFASKWNSHILDCQSRSSNDSSLKIIQTGHVAGILLWEY